MAAEGIPVRLTCGMLGHSRQTYYGWLAQPVSAREVEDASVVFALIDTHGDDPDVGYRFLADELERVGHLVMERRVWRLCSHITEHPTAQGKLYCCAIKHLFSNRIVGYALDERMNAQLVVTA